MNAPAQPVPHVMPWLPPKIAQALAAARTTYRASPLGKAGKNEDDPENAYTYFRADDVVEAGEKALGSAGLTVLFASAELGCLPARNGTLVVRRFAWLCHRDGEVMAMGLQSWPLPDRGDMSMAMSTAMTMSTARIYRELLAMTGVGAAQEESDAPRNPVSRLSGKRSTARQIGALARANGIAPAKDVSEKELREEAEELARVEAEKKANADPRFQDEGPIPDPPGLMDDEPTVPPAPAEVFDKTQDEAVPDSCSVHNTAQSSPSGTVPDGALQPDSGNSDTSSEGPESTPAGSSIPDGASHSVSSASGEVSPPDSPPAPGPSCPPECEATEEHDECVLVQPTPSQVALVASKASGVLAKRSAEGRAAKWAKATTRKAKKAFWCAGHQSEDMRRAHRGPALVEAIQPGNEHLDSGNGPRLCMACWERLESEAAGAGKEVA